MFGNIPNSGSSLDKLLRAWGLSFDTGKVVADAKFMLPVGGPNQHAPAILGLSGEGLNDKDILTAQIENVWLPFAGAFTGTPVEGLKETVLLKSSPQSQLVDGFMANLSGENILKDFKPSDTRYALAVRLTGKFKTAFPKGKPEDKKDEEKKDDEKKDGDKKPEEKPAEKKADDSLKQSAQDNDEDKEDEELFLLHFAEVFRPLTTAIMTPERLTANGIARISIHLWKLSLATIFFLVSFFSCFKRLLVSASSFRSFTNSACCSGERTKRWSLSFLAC